MNKIIAKQMSEFFSLTTSNTHINFNLFVTCTIRQSDDYLYIIKSVYLLGVLICLPVLDVLGTLFS